MQTDKNQNEHWKVLVLLLKEIADDKGVSQNEICEHTGMMQSSVSRFFSLKYKPTLDAFLKVASAIKVNFFFLDQDDKTDLNLMMEKAMTELGRRVQNLPKN